MHVEYSLYEEGRRVHRGDFFLRQSEQIGEDKDWFNTFGWLRHPSISFTLPTGRVITIDLRETTKGFAGTTTDKDGWKFGCNLNRVRNARLRFGVTAWAERPLGKTEKEPAANVQFDLFGGAA